MGAMEGEGGGEVWECSWLLGSVWVHSCNWLRSFGDEIQKVDLFRLICLRVQFTSLGFITERTILGLPLSFVFAHVSNVSNVEF